MKNYGRDPDDDVREIIEDEIRANIAAAADYDKRAEECQAEADKYRADAQRFLAANEKLTHQLAVLESALGPRKAA